MWFYCSCGQCCGSGAFLTPGSWIRFFWIPDIRSRIPDPQPIFFETSGTNFGVKSSVTNPHHFDADPDPTHHPGADPDSDYYLLGSGFLFDGNPDSTLHPDADPDQDPNFPFK